MTRQQKYPDTKSFHYYNANPKNKITGDCLYRAIATATGLEWNEVVRELAEVAIKTGYSPGSKECMNKFLEANGWKKHKQPKNGDNTKLTGIEFCEYCKNWSDPYLEENISGPVIATIGSHHITTFVQIGNGNYKCYDIWNCTSGKVGNYWYKTEE